MFVIVRFCLMAAAVGLMLGGPSEALGASAGDRSARVEKLAANLQAAELLQVSRQGAFFYAGDQAAADSFAVYPYKIDNSQSFWVKIGPGKRYVRAGHVAITDGQTLVLKVKLKNLHKTIRLVGADWIFPKLGASTIVGGGIRHIGVGGDDDDGDDDDDDNDDDDEEEDEPDDPDPPYEGP